MINLQKKIIRLIYKANLTDHTSPMFYSLRLLKFVDIHKFNVLIKMFRLIQEGKFSVSRIINTRNRNSAVPTFHRLTISQHAFSFVGPSLWNRLPDSLREITTERIFRKKLRNYLIEQYCS